MKMILALLLFIPQYGDMTYLMDYGAKIHIVSEGEDIGFGSGVYVQPNLILTANHLWVEGAKFFIDNDHTQEALVVKFDEDNDLLLLIVPKKHKHAKLGTMPKKMDTVLTVGNPMGSSTMMVVGTVTDFTDKRLLIDGKVIRGMSGGGVFSDRGFLIGICVSAWGDKDQQFMVAVSQKVIKEFIKVEVK